MIDARDGTTWTRRDLSAAVDALAPHVPLLLTPGVIIAFAEANHPRWLAVFLLLQRLGVIALPLDAALPVARQPAVAASLGAAWLLREAGSRWQSLASLQPPSPTPDPHADLCLVKTTSGSTGEPTALGFTASNMLADGRQIISTMSLTPDDINLGAIPLGHSYGLGNLVMPLILQGTAVVCSMEMLPSALATQIQRHKATVLPSVPAVLRALAETGGTDHRDALRSLRRVISAGAPLRPEVAAKFHETAGLPVRNFYGSSETGGICFDRTGEATLTGRAVGQPMDGVSVRLNDDARVVVGSPAVSSPGEWTLPDLGAWNEHGELTLTGRAAAPVNIGGRKVAPSEIERVLRGLEGVTDAWVGVGDRSAGEFLLAAVETEQSRDAILAVLAARLPAWQIPRRLWVAVRLPRTERGKLDRAELERLALT